MAKPRIVVVIPARFASTRFPGKPLALLGDGRTMIEHVVARAQAVPQVSRVLVATDDERILHRVNTTGGQAMMTREDHPSGTDRAWEVVETLHRQGETFDWVLNLQGDEPEMPIEALAGLIAVMGEPGVDIATLVCPLALPADEHLRQDANIVKAVVGNTGRALYFSRSPLPYYRNATDWGTSPCYRHLGVYLYTVSALKTMTQLPPSPLELAEGLEQLRALEAGLSIMTYPVATAPIGVDTPADLDRLLQMPGKSP